MRSFLSRLRSFARLAPSERRLALRALGWLAAARLALRVVSFARLRRFVESRRAVRDADAAWPWSVRRAVSRAARTLPGSTCLALSLVAELLLREGGHPARLTIGVSRDTNSGVETTLVAHAWVESGGMLVAGDEALDRYEKLATFGGGA